MVQKWMTTCDYPQDIAVVMLGIGLALREIHTCQFAEGDYDSKSWIPEYVWGSHYNMGDFEKVLETATSLLKFLQDKGYNRRNGDVGLLAKSLIRDKRQM